MVIFDQLQLERTMVDGVLRMARPQRHHSLHECAWSGFALVALLDRLPTD